MLTKAQLRALIDDATEDAYGDEEQQMGLLMALQDHLAIPFETEVLGQKVSVVEIDEGPSGEFVAVCERQGVKQRLPLLELPLPDPAPAGSEWIAAYRLWLSGE